MMSNQVTTSVFYNSLIHTTFGFYRIRTEDRHQLLAFSLLEILPCIGVIGTLIRSMLVLSSLSILACNQNSRNSVISLIFVRSVTVFFGLGCLLLLLDLIFTLGCYLYFKIKCQ